MPGENKVKSAKATKSTALDKKLHQLAPKKRAVPTLAKTTKGSKATVTGSASKLTKPRSRTTAASRRAEPQAYGRRAITRTTSPHAGISITVQIPPLRRPRGMAKTDQVQPSLRRRILRPVMILPALLIIGALTIFGTGSSGFKAPVVPATAAERTQPDYEPLVPSAEKASTTRYDAKRNLVTYTTTFSGVRITVSQQPLPESFAKDRDAFVKAADSLKANQQIDTDKGPLRIATNGDSNSQMAIYADKEVLVFIHCESKLDDASWKAFIELLEAKAWQETS